MYKLFDIELVFIVLILLVRKGQSFKCYKCRSDVDTGCEGEMNKSLSVQCPARGNKSEIYCRKIEQKLKFKNEEKWTIIRDCAYEKESDCYYFKWMKLGYQETCECDKEECNGAISHIPNITIVAVVIFLLGIFNYLNFDNT